MPFSTELLTRGYLRDAIGIAWWWSPGAASELHLDCLRVLHRHCHGIASVSPLVPIQKLVKNLKSHIDISIVVFPPVPVCRDKKAILRILTIMGNRQHVAWLAGFPVLIIHANVRAPGFRLKLCTRLYQQSTAGLSNFLFIRISKYYLVPCLSSFHRAFPCFPHIPFFVIRMTILLSSRGLHHIPLFWNGFTLSTNALYILIIVTISISGKDYIIFAYFAHELQIVIKHCQLGTSAITIITFGNVPAIFWQCSSNLSAVPSFPQSSNECYHLYQFVFW